MNNTAYSPEEFLDQWQALDGQGLSVAQLIQTLPQTDELLLGAGRHAHSAQRQAPLCKHTMIHMTTHNSTLILPYEIYKHSEH